MDSLGAFRGAPVLNSDGFGTGGNTGMKKTTGTVGATSTSSQWHPTIIYLIGLLIAEWVVFVCLIKFV